MSAGGDEGWGGLEPGPKGPQSCEEDLECCPRGNGSQRSVAPACAFRICARSPALATAPRNCLPHSRHCSLRWAFVSGHAPSSPRNFSCAFLSLKISFTDFLGKSPLTRPDQRSSSWYICLYPHPHPYPRPYAYPYSCPTYVHVSARIRIYASTTIYVCVHVCIYISTHRSYTFRFIIIRLIIISRTES